MMFDPVYIAFMLPGLLLSLWASFKVKSAFSQYSQVRASSGLSGAEAAAELMRRAGIRDVTVERTEGQLSDHYDPTAKALRLSADVYDGRTLAALGVAAHEAGHALQHATGYKALSFRSMIVKPAATGSQWGMYIAMAGMIFTAPKLLWLGIILFSAFVLFTLVTLPVEFNASSRAVAVLEQSGMIRADERAGTRAVLDAAALTYVAAAVSAILTLVYLLMRVGAFSSEEE